MTDSAQALRTLLESFTHTFETGGIHMPPEGRLFLLALALLLKSRYILETGYDAGVTTEALSLSGGSTTGVDNEMEYSEIKGEAKIRLLPYTNCTLIKTDAIDFLRASPDSKYDLIFVDDDHFHSHVTEECIEIKRVLRPGGIVAFHDTIYKQIWAIIEEMFPDWQKINLPCVGRLGDMGIGLVRRPE